MDMFGVRLGRFICLHCSRSRMRRTRTTRPTRHISTSSLPRVAQPSLWQSLIPRAFRKQPPSPGGAEPQPRSRPRVSWRDNPATPFIWLGILCGSQAIHTIKLKHEMAAFSRQTEARLDKLREVIRRLQSGEKGVDVEGILGTGDPQSEKEWAEALEEIDKDDYLFRESKWKSEKREKREAKAAEAAAKKSDMEKTAGEQQKSNTADSEQIPTRKRPRFL